MPSFATERSSMDNSVLVALISAGGAVLAALITIIPHLRKKREQPVEAEVGVVGYLVGRPSGPPEVTLPRFDQTSEENEEEDWPQSADLDLILNQEDGPESSDLIEVASILKDDPRWEVVARPSKGINFAPKAWLEWLPRLGLRGDPRAWIYVHLTSMEGRLSYNVGMAPLTELAKRREIVTELLKEVPKFGLKLPRSSTKEVKNNRSCITATERILEWTEKQKPQADEIRAAVKKTLDDLYPKLDKLGVVLKRLTEDNQT
jgi:hypothetical protein